MNISAILNRVTEDENTVFLFSSPYYRREKSYFLSDPGLILTAGNLEEFISVFREVEKLRKEMVIIPLIDYEAGYLFEERLQKYLPPESKKLIRILCYSKKNCTVFTNRDLTFDLSPAVENGYRIENYGLNISFDEYLKSISRIKEYIYKGDTYQVNYTVKNKFNFSGNYSSFMQSILAVQSTKYSAFINLPDEFIISLSPELFFEIEGDRIITRPMKGTAGRGKNRFHDYEIKQQLISSEKDRAENVMIVDLLRNDFGRIARFNSVKAKSLFDIEKYESVFQMTSTIEAEIINTELGPIIEQVFPCGSITGAPKLRTMEIINELEKEPRGIYTGAIGIIDDRSAKFNVAIRTMVINKKTGIGEMGLGGGIVWDSEPGNEYNEVLVKGLFLTGMEKSFKLIETMLFEKGEIFLLEKHIRRLKESARFFLFCFDEQEIKKRIREITDTLNLAKKYKLRLLLGKYGNIQISSNEIKENTKKIKLLISKEKISSGNKFQYFKTTKREQYNDALVKAREDGFFDLLFFNENGEIAEGAITNIFVLKSGVWYTPEISSGLLNGCYREHFMEKNKVIENKLHSIDLIEADKVILTNSVVKEAVISEIWDDKSIIWSYKGD